MLYYLLVSCYYHYLFVRFAIVIGCEEIHMPIFWLSTTIWLPPIPDILLLESMSYDSYDDIHMPRVALWYWITIWQQKLLYIFI